MGLRHLPKEELNPLLPGIYEQAFKLPEGNIMFGNKLRVSCAETLASLNLEEGMEASINLLSDMGWGKNNRLPQAARLVIKYKKHAQPSLAPLKEAHDKLNNGGDAKWKKLLADTIAIIEAEPPAKGKLPTISEISS